jgi:hypothetical protein
MQASVTPEVTNIVAATGIQGFVSLSLQKHPRLVESAKSANGSPKEN